MQNQMMMQRQRQYYHLDIALNPRFQSARYNQTGKDSNLFITRYYYCIQIIMFQVFKVKSLNIPLLKLLPN